MSTTTITGTINGVNNAALSNKWITFRLVQLGTDSGATATVAQSVDSVQTDANGDFSIDVWNNGDSGKTSVLEITVDGSKAESVIIPTGTASIELWDLIENYQADGSTSEQVPVVSDLFLRKSSNLSDIGNKIIASQNLDLEVGVDVQAHSATLDATTASFTTADESKLDGIEALADVTDATNIAANGGYVAGGTDVALTDGGTGASDAPTARTNLSVPSIAEAVLVANNLSELTPTSTTARTNLGVAIGSDVQAHSAILDATTASFTAADETKLDGIEALADVTDSTNILSAGGYIAGTTVVPIADGGTGATTAELARAALGVPATSEGLSAVNNLSDVADAATSRDNLQLGSVSTTDIADYATAAQGTLADNAIPTSEIGFSVQGHNAFLDSTTASFTLANDTKLSGIEEFADVTSAANITSVGGYVQGGTEVAVVDGGTGAGSAAQAQVNLGLAIGTDVQAYSGILENTTASFTTTKNAKLSLIEDLADVTNSTNISAAGGYIQGGVDVAISDGGTGASTQLQAIRNLGFPYNGIAGTTFTTSTAYSVLGTDRIILVDDDVAGQVVNIELISTAIGDGFEVIVKKLGSSHPVTIATDNSNQTIDGNLTLSITDKNQAVRLVSDGSNWRVLSPHNTNGWAIYDDYASALTPVSIINEKKLIEIDALGPSNNITYLPSGVLSLWNATDSKITPAKLGDSYDIRVDFKIEPTNINDYANFILDIGTDITPNPIVNRSLTFLKTGVSSFSIGFPVAAIQEFITNGGRMFIDTSESTSTITLSDVDLFIKRDFAIL